MSIIADLRARFDFLERDYGMEYKRPPSDKSDRRWIPSISYASEKVGVLITYDVRDEWLGIRIFDLRDGLFPLRNKFIDYTKGYPLNHLAYLAGSEQTYGSLRDENARASGKFEFPDYLALVASKLKQFGAEMLRGDFSKADRVERAGRDMIERSRAALTRPGPKT